MRYRIRQYLAGLLAAALMIAMLPAAAFAEDGAGKDAPAQVQEWIDALPAAEEITEENRSEVQGQLDAIEAAMEEMTEEEKATLDTARYEAASASLSDLSDTNGEGGPGGTETNPDDGSGNDADEDADGGGGHRPR